MSVNEIESFIIVFPDPSFSPTFTPKQVPTNISFILDLTSDLQTLSTSGTPPGGVIDGLLYVPDLDVLNPCYEISEAYIARNVTTQANLPKTDFNLIALAPWIDANCTKTYLHSAQFDPIRAFIFYIPDNGTSRPPEPNSPIWNMYDGGQWRSKTAFPIYAVPGNVGSQLMTQLSLYSGNLTAVPHGEDLLWNYQLNVTDYVRVYTEITVDASSLPGLWVFLLVVIGGILLILGMASLLMHYIQRRRRNLLRRRVERGEVDLEALGIKRLHVPKEHIERMPAYVYKCEELRNGPNGLAKENDLGPNLNGEDGKQALATLSRPERVAGGSDSPDVLTTLARGRKSSSSSHTSRACRPHSQPTCAICLDDFEHGVTTVRELPCGHIFHPECVDGFLGKSSSLCPMCKKSALPRGYCPIVITDGMVRRERAVRRLRSRVIVQENNVSVNRQVGWRHPVSNLRSTSRRIFSGFNSTPASGMRSSDPPHALPVQNQRQLSSASTSHGARDFVGLSRHEIASQRVRDLLGSEDQDVDGMQSRSKWRRAIRKVFPGF